MLLSEGPRSVELLGFMEFIVTNGSFEGLHVE